MANIITNELYFENLCSTYSPMTITYKGEEFVPFIEALKDGQIMSMIEACAASMHGGNTVLVLTRLIKNCQSKVTTDKRMQYMSPTTAAISRINVVYLAWLQEQRNAAPGYSPKAKHDSGKKSWALSVEDLNAITDVTTLDKVVSCMASHKSKTLGNKYQTIDLQTLVALADGSAIMDASMVGLINSLDAEDDFEFLKNWVHARRRLASLKKGAKAVEASDNLMAKLAKGGKTTLSAAEVAEVAELLKLLGK